MVIKKSLRSGISSDWESQLLFKYYVSKLGRGILVCSESADSEWGEGRSTIFEIMLRSYLNAPLTRWLPLPMLWYLILCTIVFLTRKSWKEGSEQSTWRLFKYDVSIFICLPPIQLLAAFRWPTRLGLQCQTLV